MSIVKKLLAIGCGDMGAALVKGINQFATKEDLDFFCYTPSATRAKALAQQVGGVWCKSLQQAPLCDYYLLACRPQQLQSVIDSGWKLPPASLGVSILAGTPIKSLVSLSEGRKDWLRLMPNLAVSRGKSVNLVYASPLKTELQHLMDHLLRVLAQTGVVLPVEREQQMETLTAFSGSGPGLIFELMRIWQEILQRQGFSSQWSKTLVQQVFSGSVDLAQANPLRSFEQMRKEVTSSGGVTEAALGQLENNLGPVWEKAFEVGITRCQQLVASLDMDSLKE